MVILPNKRERTQENSNMYGAGKKNEGHLGGSAVERLPSAQGTRIGSHIGLPSWSLLLPLPVSLPVSLPLSLSLPHSLSLFLSVSFMNK